jgi:putative transposase
MIEGHKLADFYSATITLYDRSCGPILHRVLHLTQGVIDRAIARIKEIDAEQCAMRQLGPINLTVKQINRAQQETFWGLSLGSEAQIEAIGSAAPIPLNASLLSDEITVEAGPLPEERPVLPIPLEGAAEEWFFSDELEDGDFDINDTTDQESNDE